MTTRRPVPDFIEIKYFDPDTDRHLRTVYAVTGGDVEVALFGEYTFDEYKIVMTPQYGAVPEIRSWSA